MINSNISGGKALRIAFGAMVIVSLLFFSASIAQTTPGGGLEIRGEVAEGPFEWDAYNFQAFFYDLMGDGKTERLNISSITGRKIPAGSLIYDTHTIPKDYGIYEKKRILVNGKGNYSILGLQGKMYVAFNDNASKITELLFEQENNDVKTLSSSESLDMDEGYTLVPDQIDSANNKVRLNLAKDDIVVNSSIVQNQTALVVNGAKEGEVGPIFVTYVDSIGSNTVNIKYSWLVSENISVVEVGQKFGNGNLSVDEATNSEIVFKNNVDINLLKGSIVNVTDTFKFNVADNNILRYYPFVEYTQPGKYEIRGTIFSEPTESPTMPFWNAQSFAGFFYNLNNNISTETLGIQETLADLQMSRIISKNMLIYITNPTPLQFKMNEKEGVTVDYERNYSVVGWQGEKWVAVNGIGYKLAKLVFEMGAEETKIMTSGENWSLGEGYELTVNAIDSAAIPWQVWFTLRKNGAVVDEGIGQAPSGTSLEDKQKAVYFKKMTILSESDALLFTIYVNNISTNSVEFKYGWLIDTDSAKEIEGSDEFGVFEVTRAGADGISMYNKNPVSISRNSITTLMGNLKFKVADNAFLRFYPKVDYVIPEGSIPPYSLSISINNRDVHSTSTSVTLSLSAINATEMSFSNDIISWSPWEPYATTKSWNLANGDGTKTVYFKARNAEGEADPVSDTIILNKIIYINKVEVRGSVADAGADNTLMPSWNAQNFAGFFYDLKNNISSETLTIGANLASLQSNLTIPKNLLVYTTHPSPFQFKMNEKEGVTVQDEPSYLVVGWQGEKWVAVNNVGNKLAKLVFEMGAEETKTMTPGENWSLGAGYELTVNTINSLTVPRQVMFTLKKDGTIIDNGIAPAPTSSADKQNAVYVKTMTIAGESDALLFTVYVKSIFSSSTSEMVQFKYAWLIDQDSAKEISAADTYGAFEVAEATSDRIILWNKNSITLPRNTETSLMGSLKFKTADSDTLRFYPEVTYTDPGNYEVRGSVADAGADYTIIPSWNAHNFAGFFYDLKNNISSETLTTGATLSDLQMNSNIPKNVLTYATNPSPLQFKMNEKEGVTVNNKPSYSVVGWQGEKWVAVNGIGNKIAPLVFEMGSEDTKTMTLGENWSLGAGYELTVNIIDISAIPWQVWFTLRKDGDLVDEGFGQAPSGTSLEDKQKAVYFKTMAILGESDALLFTIYVNNISSNAVEFKYGWLIDTDSVKEIEGSDEFGVFEVTRAGADGISMYNKNPVSISRNSETTLMGNLKFKVADNAFLRFYPKVDYVIPEGSIPPYSLSISINHGDTYCSSTSVTLSLSAINATEMSFSNDIISWSPWEPYATTKSWNLANGDGAKTVYFKARNAAGESEPVIDTITLDKSNPSIIGKTPIGSVVPVNAQINVTFSEAMNRTSAEGAFSTIPDTNGTFNWSSNTMTYTPDFTLAASTTYNVTVGTDAKDVAGNNLESSYSWQFTTGSPSLNWKFISVPYELENSTVAHVLQGIEYESLFAWDPIERKLVSPVTNFKPLQGYLIKMNTSQTITNLKKKTGVYMPPSIDVIHGWNLIGTKGTNPVSAETMLQSIDDSYYIIWNWNVTNQKYDDIVGFNTNSRPPGSLGTDEFIMQPGISYWVWATANTSLY